MAAAIKMVEFMEKASWIRKMFEEGARLKKIHGEENVFDFSLGNPNVTPPDIVKARLLEVIEGAKDGAHGYTPNAGLPETREAVAAYLSKEHGLAFTQDHVIMTCGAAGAVNICLKALLDPGDEVLTVAPYFVEYGFYADNHGGVLRAVPTREDFSLDLNELEQGINSKTKVVLINSPNNPTGQVYPGETLEQMGKLLDQKSKEYNRTIYLVADEPYRKIVYDGYEVPSIFKYYQNSLIATSYSKDLSLPGERIGFVAVHSEMDQIEPVLGALILANRILGFVNAPVLMQRAIIGLQEACVDVNIYRRKRDRLVDQLRSFGYDCINPPGAFYLFPKSPLEDEVEFVKVLQEENILVVPGRGFGKAGHFRIAYCVEDKTIEGALPGFRQAIEKACK
jgi:aspartate aminotransferase